MKRFFVVILLLSVITISCQAHQRDGHIRDWNKAFGIEDSNSKEAIEPLWDTAQDLIDHYQEDYEVLQEVCPWFNIGIWHRLLFHWGFNGDPAKHEPLLNVIDKCLDMEIRERNLDMDAAEQYRNSEKEKLFGKLYEIQSLHNRLLIAKVELIFNIDSARQYPNAIATLIHDIHLLGDHTTTDTDNLMKLDALTYDIDKLGFERLFNGAQSSRLSRAETEYNKTMKQIKKALDDETEHDKKVKLLLESINKYLPVVLYERFGNTLRKEGITITSHF